MNRWTLLAAAILRAAVMAQARRSMCKLSASVAVLSAASLPVLSGESFVGLCGSASLVALNLLGCPGAGRSGLKDVVHTLDKVTTGAKGVKGES